MLFESSKMNEITIQSESRHSIFDCLFRVRRCFSDRHPYLFQNLLNIVWEACNVLIYVLGCYLISSHQIFFRKILKHLNHPAAAPTSCLAGLSLRSGSRNPSPIDEILESRRTFSRAQLPQPVEREVGVSFSSICPYPQEICETEVVRDSPQAHPVGCRRDISKNGEARPTNKPAWAYREKLPYRMPEGGSRSNLRNFRP